MPAKSKAQFRFMEAVAHGMKPKGGKGPSVSQAKEFVAATPSYKALPAKKGKTNKRGILG